MTVRTHISEQKESTSFFLLPTSTSCSASQTKTKSARNQFCFNNCRQVRQKRAYFVSVWGIQRHKKDVSLKYTEEDFVTFHVYPLRTRFHKRKRQRKSFSFHGTWLPCFCLVATSAEKPAHISGQDTYLEEKTMVHLDLVCHFGCVGSSVFSL